MKINVLAADPGLATFGLAIAQTDGYAHELAHADVFESEQRVDDFDIRLCDDRARRARELACWLRAAAAGRDVQLIAAEAMSFPRGANAIVCVSLAWGVLSAFAEWRGIPIISAMPSYWRSALLGERPTRRGSKAQRKAATQRREDAAHAIAIAQVPNAARLIALRVRPALQPHVLDALGVFVWGTSTRELHALVGR